MTTAVQPFTGALSVLSSVHGDLSITFQPDDSAEVIEKASKTITDLLSRGYFISAKTKNGTWRRVRAFDPAKREYIVREVGGDTALPIQETSATAVAPLAGG